LRPSATLHEADTARIYDIATDLVDMGVDLLAFALLIATLRDWLAICQRSMPPVFWIGRQCNAEERLFHAILCSAASTHTKSRSEHPRRYHQVGQHKARHPER
jgi:hypothetical protein